MKKATQNVTPRPNSVRQLCAELAGKIASLIGNEENRITEIPSVSLHRRTAPTPPCRTTYHPGIIVVAQGSKQVNLGKSSFIYDQAHYLLTAVDLPIVSWVAEATPQVPCLVLSLKLDISIVRDLLSREEIHIADAPSDSLAMSIGETTPDSRPEGWRTASSITGEKYSVTEGSTSLMELSSLALSVGTHP